MKTYRAAFVLAVIGNLLLILLVAGLWWHYRKPTTTTAEVTPASADQGSGSSASTTTSVTQETPLAPVQISPQRLQSIGVKTSAVERKSVEDEIRTTGTIAVDETKFAYVQVRYSGYIEKVFADATYQYVHKGQPLFTIYSPDLVATEREYLVAKQNQQQVARSTIPGVASGAASLLDAAVNRLKQWQVPDSEIERLEK